MGFSMRVNFVDVVCDGSLKNTYANGAKNGYAFDIRLSYYRGHFLSDIDLFEVYLDGEKADEHDVSFGINGKEFSVFQLPYLISEFWTLLEPAHIKVRKPGGLEKGTHRIDVKLMLRVPYLPLPGGDNDHCYMPLDSCGGKEFVLDENMAVTV